MEYRCYFGVKNKKLNTTGLMVIPLTSVPALGSALSWGSLGCSGTASHAALKHSRVHARHEAQEESVHLV
jgi:hypothetical protein